MREYELITIWNPDMGEDGISEAMGRLTTVISTRGGEIADTNMWGRRRLAYIINKHSEGIYVVMQLRLPPRIAGDVESQLRINEDVLRHLLVRKDD